MPPREWTFRIQDILDAVEKIRRLHVRCEPRNLRERWNSSTRWSTILRSLARPPITFRARSRRARQAFPGGRWSTCATSPSTRSDLRPAVIWDTIQNDLPPLVEPLRNLLSGAR